PGILCCSTLSEKDWSINPEDRGGIPIGWRRDYVYDAQDNVSYDFTDDTIFIFLTDGVLDIGDLKGEMAGENTLRMLIGVLSSESELVSMPFRLLQSMSTIGYSQPSDDICLAVVKKNSPEPNTLKLFIEPDIAKVGDCAEKFGTFVQDQTHDAEIATRVELLLSEFLNNVVIHGLSSKLRTQSGMVVKVEVKPSEVLVTVMDRGKSWNCGGDVNNADAELEKRNEAMTTSGRGMAIVHSIASSICRKRYGVLNETVFLVKR
ncbi:MAG: ATP-binding protein, partial [Victivallaceae bacterium]|nr:ATP-binding protein [Victivallaceae bacterium]